MPTRDGFAYRQRLRPTSRECLVRRVSVERAARPHTAGVEEGPVDAGRDQPRFAVAFEPGPGNTGLAAEQATQRDAREQETEPANGESNAELGKRILEVVTAGAGER